MKDLNALLAEERAALLAGDFARLTALAERKLALLDGLETSSLSAEVLAATRTTVDRNQQLYTAALSGIASARDRLKALGEVRDGLRVYDQQGQKVQVTAKPQGLERKA